MNEEKEKILLNWDRDLINAVKRDTGVLASATAVTAFVRKRLIKERKIREGDANEKA